MHWRVALGRIKRLLVVLAVSAALLPLSRWLFVSSLPFDPIAYDGRPLRVEGVVANLDMTVSRHGNPYHSLLLDTGGGMVTVLKFGLSPKCVEGQRATVVGVFHRKFERGGRTFSDEIDARSISCA